MSGGTEKGMQSATARIKPQNSKFCKWTWAGRMSGEWAWMAEEARVGHQKP